MQLKQFVSSIIRKAGLASFADKARYAFNYLAHYQHNKKFVAAHPEFVFPPAYFIYETYTLDLKDYYEDGKQTATEIIDLLKGYVDINSKDFQLLDWGCGPARVLRHMPALLNLESKLFGCDYNASYINWCSKAIPGIGFIRNDLQPPVQLPSNSMNIIYGLSIFTHLSEANHLAWIDELYRLLKPGGVILVTTQGDRFKHKLLPEEISAFEKAELVVRAFENEGHRMYAAFQPEQYMKRVLEKFIILEFIPGGSANSVHALQDTWIARKL